MPNNIKTRPVPIELDKKRHLQFDLNALVELEEEYEDIGKAFEGLEQGKMKAIRAPLWAGLVHEDETLTPKNVGRLVTIHNLQTIAETITGAIQQSLPEGDGSKNSQTPA